MAAERLVGWTDEQDGGTPEGDLESFLSSHAQVYDQAPTFLPDMLLWAAFHPTCRQSLPRVSITLFCSFHFSFHICFPDQTEHIT